MVKQGDSIPNVDLFEATPGNKVNLAEVLKSGKGIILGVPAAFSEFSRVFLLSFCGCEGWIGLGEGCCLRDEGCDLSAGLRCGDGSMEWVERGRLA